MKARLCLDIVAANLNETNDNIRCVRKTSDSFDVYEEDTHLGVIRLEDNQYDTDIVFEEAEGETYSLFEDVDDAKIFQVKGILLDFYDIISRNYLNVEEER